LPLVNENHILRDRLVAFHLIDKLDDTEGLQAVLKKYAPGTRTEYDLYWGEEKYRIIAAAAPDQLPSLIWEIVNAGIDVTDPLVLLQMTPEALIDMNKDFAVDETWLQTRTKDQLLSYAKKFGLELEGIKEGSKKGDIVKAIAAFDLRGKLPAEVANECKIKKQGAAKGPEEKKGERKCRQCGCTDDNCEQCIEKTGEPCHWVQEDLCSACAGDKEGGDVE
jgi:hypothetical protein